MTQLELVPQTPDPATSSRDRPTEAAQVLRISRSSAYDLARRWRSDDPTGLPNIRLGRFLRVPRSALEEVLARPGQLYASLAAAERE